MFDDFKFLHAKLLFCDKLLDNISEVSSVEIQNCDQLLIKYLIQIVYIQL